MVAAAVMGVATVGGAMIGSSANKKAANTAADAQRYASDQNAALAREQMARADQYTAGLTPYASMGANALASRLGLTGRDSGWPSAAPANALAPAAPVTASNALAAAANDPRAPTRSTGNMTPTAPSPVYAQSGGIDVQAYAAANPDVAQRAAQLTPAELQAGGWPSKEAWIAQHAQDAQMRGENRDYPMLPAQAAPTPVGQPEGYDPAYYGDTGGADMPTFGPRPELGPRPNVGSAPSQDDYFGDFEESDYYRWLQDETRRATNVQQYARGVGSSGGTLKALQDRAGMVASGYRDNWFNQQMGLYQSALGQFNTDRSFANSIYDIDATRADARYDADRNFNYGAAVDNRNFLAGRFDTETANIFGLAGIGTGAINTALGQGQNTTNALMAANNKVADATGNAALIGASNTNALMGQSLNALSNYYGNRNSSGSTGISLFGLGANNSLKGLY